MMKLLHTSMSSKELIEWNFLNALSPYTFQEILENEKLPVEFAIQQVRRESASNKWRMVNNPTFLDWASNERSKSLLQGKFNLPIQEIVDRWQTFLKAEDRMSWKSYLGFAYVIDGITYLEAYPIHVGVDPEDFQKDFEKNYSLDSEIFLAPSRNQVRKYLYHKHVNSTGSGFDKHPYRVNA